MKVSQRINAFILCLLLCSHGTVALADPFMLYLIRHAEKESTGADPALSTQGQQRAQNIAELLKSVGLQKIYSTAFARTRQTAAPIATALSLTVQTYDPSQLRALAQQLKGEKVTALIVGHSNTTPDLVHLLGGESGGLIDEKIEFDRLYQLIITDDDRVTTVLLHSHSTNAY